MKSSTVNKVKGKLHQASGKVKEVTGEAIDNNEMQIKGKSEIFEGKVQEKTGEIEQVADK
ncbi:CsbD family protein [Desulfovibrio gilichinskyi]|uniref:CsbD-like n=1 Tax=Desulfovibrio gilichinskyi TaxID=1519643 RepID=A0A1X7EXF9_9BACT|nr:CsbD family protein [Desulfovibrio gilichinskyi]SMF41868.1 CsbD-like [Desulfovibrio gilichinskyi]